MGNRVSYNNLGLIDYKEAWEYQEELLQDVVNNKLNNSNNGDYLQHLLFCQHPNVYTLGKSGTENNLLINEDFLNKINARYYKINRGGDITYHGPGQLVVYPIFDLDKFGIGVKDYIVKLEQAVINLLMNFNIQAGRLQNATGVWLDPESENISRKICAIGVRISRSVTMHGLAFNINTDLSYYNYINPCGFTDKSVSSMEKELGETQNYQLIEEKLLQEFRNIFNLDIV
ncbi:lipoyl(octanoyl) transferase LipB [Bacteroidota bacterium]